MHDGVTWFQTQQFCIMLDGNYYNILMMSIRSKQTHPYFCVHRAAVFPSPILHRLSFEINQYHFHTIRTVQRLCKSDSMHIRVQKPDLHLMVNLQQQNNTLLKLCTIMWTKNKHVSADRLCLLL